MKKIRISAVLLLIVSTVIFVAFCIFDRMHQDQEPPVISFAQEVCTVSVQEPEEALLRDVQAQDKRSGDVSDTLVIESISPLMEGNTRIVTYAAIDDNGNVARADRTMQYVDYQKPSFHMTQPLRFMIGQDMDIFTRIGADSVLDGDLSGKVKYTLSDGFDATVPGNYSIEFSVTDSAGSVVYLPTYIEVYEGRTERIQVTLTTYLAHLNLNEPFDAESYFVESDMEGDLTIQSNVNTAVPGVYHVDYVVEGSNDTRGVGRLLVVVGEQ